MNCKRWFKLAGFITAMCLINGSAFAIMVKSDATATGTTASTQSTQISPASPGIKKSGVISAIDVGRNTIVINGETYMFVPGLTTVRASNPLVNGNPLKLAPGQSIQFITATEAGARQRVTEVILK